MANTGSVRYANIMKLLNSKTLNPSTYGMQDKMSTICLSLMHQRSSRSYSNKETLLSHSQRDLPSRTFSILMSNCKNSAVIFLNQDLLTPILRFQQVVLHSTTGALFQLAITVRGPFSCRCLSGFICIRQKSFLSM